MNTNIIAIIMVLFIVILVIPLDKFEFPIQEVDASETRTIDNDNSFGNATEIFTPGKYTGSVNESDDMGDMYKINLTANNTHGELLFLNYTITDTNGIGIMAIMNPEFYQIVTGMCNTWLRSFFNVSICACTSGYYYIAIIGFGSETHYSLNVNWSSTARIMDNDNTNATANTAIGGGSYNGTIEPIYDYLDLYNITLTSGATTTQGIIVELDNYTEKKLFVYGADGRVREWSDIGSSNNPDDKEIVKFAADKTGTYRIAVMSSYSIVMPYPQKVNYTLNTTIISDIPNDLDYDREHATLVFNGTMINTSFNSEFDKSDFYMIDLDQNDELTISVLYKDGSGVFRIDIFDPQDDWILPDLNLNSSKGGWTSIIAQQTGRYYIEVETGGYRGNYTILFSLGGENLLIVDEPVRKNNTIKDFSMLEDTIDMSHVNLNDIFHDPDSPIIFGSPSHPSGMGENIDLQILPNGTVKFTPHQDFFGFEVCNFSGLDIKSNTLCWDVNVTVLPENDPPQISSVSDKTWTQDSEVNFTLEVADVDNTNFIFTDNTNMFDVDPVDKRILFIPQNEHVGMHAIQLNVSDGEKEASVEFSAEILNKNDPPEILTVGGKDSAINEVVTLKATEDTWYNFTVEAIDIDHSIGVMDTLKFTTNISDPLFNIDLYTGEISFFPLQKHIGNVDIKITVDDGNGGEGFQNISIEVSNVNDKPTKPDIIIQDRDGLSINFSAEGVVDEDGDELTYTWNFGDGSSLVTGKNIGHKYSDYGDYEITLSASDGNGGISVSYFTINISKPIIDIDDKPDDFKDNQTTNDTIIDDDIKDDNDTIEEDNGDKLPIDTDTTEEKSSFMAKWWLFPMIGLIVIVILIVIATIFFRNKKTREGMVTEEEEVATQEDSAAISEELEEQVTERPPTAEELYGEDVGTSSEPIQETEIQIDDEQISESQNVIPQDPGLELTNSTSFQIAEEATILKESKNQIVLCPNCGMVASFVGQYGKCFCSNCHEYF